MGLHLEADASTSQGLIFLLSESFGEGSCGDEVTEGKEKKMLLNS